MNMLSSPVCLYALAMAGFILVAGTAHSLMDMRVSLSG